MRILDEKGRSVDSPDMDAGRLVEGSRPIYHRFEVTQHEQGHYETVAEYPNGGKDVAWVVDVPEEGVWRTYDDDGNELEDAPQVPDGAPREIEVPDLERVMRYIPFTEDEIARNAELRVEARIEEYRQRLADTDYIAMKIAEGSATRDEYADVIAQRREWRERMNELRG